METKLANGNMALAILVIGIIVAITIAICIFRICVVRYRGQPTPTIPTNIELAPLPLKRSHTSSRGG